MNQSQIFDFRPKIMIFFKKRSLPKFGNYFWHLIIVAALKFLILPKFFIIAQKNRILLKFWKLGGNCPSVPPRYGYAPRYHVELFILV